MVTTRTRISSDYVKSSSSSSHCTTRTRVSPDYVRRTSSCFNASAVLDPCLPVCTTRTYMPISTRPVIMHRSSSVVLHDAPITGAEIAARIVVTSVVLLSLIAVIAALPACHTEEVCDGWTALGDRICHLERVCHSRW